MKIRCRYTDPVVGNAINDFLEEADNLFEIFGGLTRNENIDPDVPRRLSTPDFELLLTNKPYATDYYTWGTLELTAKTPEAELWLMANMPPNAEILEA